MRCFFIALFLLVTSCNRLALNEPPLSYSVMPRYLELDSIKAVFDDDTSDVVDSSYTDFKSLPLDSGILYTIYDDTMSIPPGILISDRKAALYIFYKSAWERYQVELKYMDILNREYYNKAKAAEVLYQEEIKRLKKRSQRTWIERNLGYIGFAAGVTVGLLNSAILVQIVE